MLSSISGTPHINEIIEFFHHDLVIWAFKLVVFGFSFLLTYLLTYIRFVIQTWSLQVSGIYPSPVPPYLVPGLGHTYSIIFNAERFLRPLHHVLSLSTPLSPILHVLPGEGVRSLFRAPKDLVPVRGTFDALKVFFGLTPADYHVFNNEYISALEAKKGKQYSTSHADASRPIMELQRNDFVTFLHGQNLRLVMDGFSFNLGQLFRSHDSHVSPSEPVNLPDLYVFLPDSIFRAEIEALYGKHIFTALPVISRGSPRWLYPAQYQSRDKVLHNLGKWRRYPYKEDEELGNAVSNPIWGTHYMKNMVRRYEDLELSNAGIPSVLHGFLFVTTANSIPAATWMALHILLDKPLVSRLRQELLKESEAKNAPIDYTALLLAPLLNPVYRETLRLNESVWNTARQINGRTEYPVESFWAERFLEYTDDPRSGPLRKPPSTYANTIGTSPVKPFRDDSKARLPDPAALRGHFFPFGGGAWRCPGEILAKKTILVTAFLLPKELDVYIFDPMDAAKASSQHRMIPFGTHAFDRKVPIRCWKRSQV
ncbi:cytochrome P450 [Colletotrichum navitas]|uniref:Cytochrome P450 n=1 Tax=Colletotrichum navitas TaxID=681940 RepID=A0AAD8Q1H6_9PEZI|nr:cytochrome P450 [Colletotrichum navitas]KAK1594135.1 cytochrome P450 [Colletotrichum navitas]